MATISATSNTTTTTSTTTTSSNKTTTTTSKSSILSNLGVGKTMLKQETIDQLKAADEGLQISPITSRINDNKAQQEDLDALKLIANNLKTTLSSLTNENNYLQRSVNSSGSGSVSATVQPGVSLQTMKIGVSQLAQQDVYQSKAFSDKTATIANDLGSKTANLKLSVGEKSFNIKIDSSTTISDLAQSINNLGGDLQAKVLNVGGENPYRLIIQSKETGEANTINFGYGADEDGNITQDNKDNVNSVLQNLGFSVDNANSTDDKIAFDTAANLGGSQIQKAQDAKFTYNGVDITRSSNTVDDLITGVTFKLNKIDESSSSTELMIANNTDTIKNNIKLMVSAYNQLTNAIDTTTKYDKESGESGTLQGVNEITAMSSKVKQFMSAITDGKSIQDFGFSFADDGTLKVDDSKFSDALENNFDAFKKFFSSSSEYSNISYSAKNAVGSGTVSGEFKINGVSVSVNTSGTQEENAKAVVEAINKAGIHGITASVGEDNKISIAGSYGASIKVTGDDEYLLNSLGLNNVNLTGKTTSKKGFFDNLTSLIDSYTNSKTGILTTYATGLATEAKSLTAQKESVQSTIDSKYEIMKDQFTKYETIMNRLTSQFESMKSTFEALLKSND